MLSAAMSEKLNDQIANEFGAAHAYLAMACVLDGMELPALTKFFRAQSEEERSHALKILDYVLESGGEAKLAAIPAATAKFKSVLAIAEAALKHEEKVTAQIHAIAKLARDEADFATGSFIQWFVDEQVEEIATMTRLVQAAKYAGENLLQLDNYVGRNMLGGD